MLVGELGIWRRRHIRPAATALAGQAGPVRSGHRAACRSGIVAQMTEAGDLWLERVRRRDPEAVGELWAQHVGPLTRFLEGLLHHPAEAEDLAREALLRFWARLDHFRGEASVKTFLFQIAHNLALNHLSSAATRRETFPGELPDRSDPAPGPADLLERGEESARLRSALRGLPPQQRAVVMLRTWEDLSFKEVAAVLGLAEGTAKAHYFFALRNLRKRLEARHDSP